MQTLISRVISQLVFPAQVIGSRSPVVPWAKT